MNIKRKSANKTYDNFLVYVPVELARDSQFPFKPKDVVAIRVDPSEEESHTRTSQWTSDNVTRPMRPSRRRIRLGL